MIQVLYHATVQILNIPQLCHQCHCLHPCPERPQRGALHALTDDGIQDITFFSTLLDLVHLTSPASTAGQGCSPTRHRELNKTTTVNTTQPDQKGYHVSLFTGKKKKENKTSPSKTMLPPRFLEAAFHSLPSRGRDTQNLSR